MNRGDTSILAASFAEAAARELYIILKKIHFKEFEKVIRWINNQDFAAAVAAVLLLLLLSSALSDVLKYATKYSVPDFSAMVVERFMFIRFIRDVFHLTVISSVYGIGVYSASICFVWLFKCFVR